MKIHTPICKQSIEILKNIEIINKKIEEMAIKAKETIKQLRISIISENSF